MVAETFWVRETFRVAESLWNIVEDSFWVAETFWVGETQRSHFGYILGGGVILGHEDLLDKNDIPGGGVILDTFWVKESFWSRRHFG